MSETSGPYDPNAVDGDRSGGTQYVTKKDVKVVLIGGALIAAILWPIYNGMKGQSERTRCKANLKSISDALGLYATEHDNHYPPAYRTEEDGETPALTENGRPYSWATDISPYMNARHSFLCPTADEKETVLNESLDPKKKTIVSSYGMYLPYGGLLTSLVENPDQVVLLTETSNQGSEKTLDPKPLGGRPDGFVIAWSDTNALPTKGTESVTRLAFPDSAQGKTDKGRHGDFVYGLSATGELLQLHPQDAAYRLPGIGGVNPHWRLPPGYATSR